MNEQQYINATNRVKVSTAIVILRDVLISGNCAINKDEFREIQVKLAHIEADLFKIVQIKG